MTGKTSAIHNSHVRDFSFLLFSLCEKRRKNHVFPLLPPVICGEKNTGLSKRVRVFVCSRGCFGRLRVYHRLVRGSLAGGKTQPDSRAFRLWQYWYSIGNRGCVFSTFFSSSGPVRVSWPRALLLQKKKDPSAGVSPVLAGGYAQFPDKRGIATVISWVVCRVLLRRRRKTFADASTLWLFLITRTVQV